MEEIRFSALNKQRNIRFLRRYLNLTQKDFINQFLSDENGKPSMSVATFSNLESKGGARINEVVLAAAENLGMDAMLFSMEPERFADRLEMILPDQVGADGLFGIGNTKKSNINQLLNRLTLYFAEKLLDKTLKKGDKIESERVLAEKLGVGRSAVREALKVLDILGMIDIRPGQGSFISNDETDFFSIPLSWSLFLNGNQVESILEIRNILEKRAAELTAESITEEHLQRLEDVYHGLHQAYVSRNYKEFLDADTQFHICLAEYSGNQAIYSMILVISNLLKHVSGTGMANEAQMKEIYEEHQLIYGAVLAHDAAAAGKYTEDHLIRSMHRYNYR